MQTYSTQNEHIPKHLPFLQWYLLVRPKEIVGLYIDYAYAFAEVFAIFFLLKTLFSPWKSIKDEYPTKGFNFTLILETWSMNVTTRVIGAIVRLAVIVFGIAVQIALLIVFIIYLLGWILFPLLFVTAIPLLFIPLF